MKKTLLCGLALTLLSNYLSAQITFRGCENVLGAQDYTLEATGTTDDGGTIRNTYETLPADFGQSCPAGVCELRIQWNIGFSRWEIQLDNDGPLGNPDYTTAILYYNTSASSPNPPDLSLGAWQNAGFCPGAITTLTGDVQSEELPVELLFFKSSVISKQIVLEWSTASEINNEKFEIEESRTGQEFIKIGEVEGKGTTLVRQNYSFELKNPRRGDSYYRLRQIDIDGQFEFSNVVSVNFNEEGETIGEFYPNPSKSGLVNLEYYTQNDKDIDVSVFDINGKLVYNQIQKLSKGANNLIFEFLNLNTGIYYIKIGDGIYFTHRKLFIER